MGDLGVGLQRRRPPRHLPVQGLRRSRPGPEARPRRRAGGRSLRHRPRRHDRPGRSGAQPAPPRRARASRAPTASTSRSTTRTATPREDERAPASERARHRGAGLHGAPPGHDADRPRQRAARPPHGRALPRRPARARHASSCCRSACPRRRRSPSRGRSKRPGRRCPPAPPRVRRIRSPHTAVSARAVPRQRQLHRRWSPTPAAGPASGAAAR